MATGLALGCVLAFLSASQPLQAAPISRPAPLEAIDLAGKRHVFSASGGKASALIFVAHDCPISNAYAPEINRIAAEYGRRGIELFVVYAENGFSASQARAHAQQFGYKVPLILDSNHQLSAALGASVTPEAVLLSPTGKRLYLGRINNRYATWGQARNRVTQNDLREALDATLAGKAVPHPTTRAIGCFIPGAA